MITGLGIGSRNKCLLCHVTTVKKVDRQRSLFFVRLIRSDGFLLDVLLTRPRFTLYVKPHHNVLVPIITTLNF